MEALEDLGGGGGGHGLDEGGEGPGVEEADVGSADAVKGAAGEVVRVAGGGEQHGAGVAVDLRYLVRVGVGEGSEAEKWEGEERGDVGVVHEEVAAVSVCFVGEDFAEFGVRRGAVFEDAGSDGRGLLREVVGEAPQGVDVFGVGLSLGGVESFGVCEEDLRCAAKFDAHHGVGGDEEGEDGRIVAGAEGGADQARVVGHCIT